MLHQRVWAMVVLGTFAEPKTVFFAVKEKEKVSVRTSYAS